MAASIMEKIIALACSSFLLASLIVEFFLGENTTLDDMLDNPEINRYNTLPSPKLYWMALSSLFLVLFSLGLIVFS